jgi:hypothetical protein
MTSPPDPETLDAVLLCYCTGLTVSELRTACRERRWPLPGKERSGKLCTGCMGDLLHCLRRFDAADPDPVRELP